MYTGTRAMLPVTQCATRLISRSSNKLNHHKKTKKTTENDKPYHTLVQPLWQQFASNTCHRQKKGKNPKLNASAPSYTPPYTLGWSQHTRVPHAPHALLSHLQLGLPPPPSPPLFLFFPTPFSFRRPPLFHFTFLFTSPLPSPHCFPTPWLHFPFSQTKAATRSPPADCTHACAACAAA